MRAGQSTSTDRGLTCTCSRVATSPVRRFATAALGYHRPGRRHHPTASKFEHSRLTAKLRPMRGLKTHRTADVVIRGHAFVQNLGRDQYEQATDTEPMLRRAAAFDGLSTRSNIPLRPDLSPRVGARSNHATGPFLHPGAWTGASAALRAATPSGVCRPPGASHAEIATLVEDASW